MKTANIVLIGLGVLAGIVVFAIAFGIIRGGNFQIENESLAKEFIVGFSKNWNPKDFENILTGNEFNTLTNSEVKEGLKALSNLGKLVEVQEITSGRSGPHHWHS